MMLRVLGRLLRQTPLIKTMWHGAFERTVNKLSISIGLSLDSVRRQFWSFAATATATARGIYSPSCLGFMYILTIILNDAKSNQQSIDSDCKPNLLQFSI